MRIEIGEEQPVLQGVGPRMSHPEGSPATGPVFLVHLSQACVFFTSFRSGTSMAAMDTNLIICVEVVLSIEFGI